MNKVLRSTLRVLAVAAALAAVMAVVGSAVPVGSQSGPYLSALSNAAVKTAEACPCNFKICLNNVCIPIGSEDDPSGCCVIGGICRWAYCL